MAGNIYFCQGNETLQPMTEQPYETEEVVLNSAELTKQKISRDDCNGQARSIG
jgi:hypothetical protein